MKTTLILLGAAAWILLTHDVEVPTPPVRYRSWSELIDEHMLSQANALGRAFRDVLSVRPDSYRV